MNAPAYTCRYCRQPSDATVPSCPNCGAPTDVKAAVTNSGWTKQPPIKDMAHIQFGQSKCQIEGTNVPVADFRLAEGDSIYFSHHNLLWNEPTAQLGVMNMGRDWLKRKIGGMDVFMLQGAGPGRIGLADTHAGEIVVLPLHHNQQMWVRNHRFLAATGNIGFQLVNNNFWYRTRNGDETETHYPMGYFGDVFSAQGAPGLLLLHAPGNTFIRDLAPQESLLIDPSALLYRDVSVGVHMHVEYPQWAGGGMFGKLRSYSHRHLWARLIGPGRVAVQSVYEPAEQVGSMVSHSAGTEHRW